MSVTRARCVARRSSMVTGGLSRRTMLMDLRELEHLPDCQLRGRLNVIATSSNFRSAFAAMSTTLQDGSLPFGILRVLIF
jgi:hypothetical protein